MQAYSLDLRERVVADREAGLPTGEVAHKYRVSAAWVRRLMQRYRTSGQVAPKRRTQYQTPLLAPYRAQLAALIAAQPDCDAGRVTGRPRGLGQSHHGLAGRAGSRADRKKKSCTPPNKTDLMSGRPGSAGVPRPPTLMGDRLVFLDETALQTKMTRRYGRSRRGTRLVAKVPHATGRPRQSLPLCGRTNSPPPPSSTARSMAPASSPISNRCSPPRSSRATASLWTIWPVIKSGACVARLPPVGAHLLYLPPYSPDFNPSSRSLPNSKRACALSPPARCRACGRPWGPLSVPSRLRSAPITSATLAIASLQQHENCSRQSGLS